ncbi:hypothetical protein [Mesorhizobium sp. Root552]|jgi:hypothetical protein|uniref:hypothetical protein n=1 Tax=Mesorhizobium sp. Root552 TaxID=1736555 RepID=UPI000AD07B94|nr:hypothetical protein [Mesorhizobium sp. Root552]
MKDDIISKILDSETIKDAATSVSDYLVDTHTTYADVATTAAREAGQLAVSAHETLVDTVTAIADGVQDYAAEAFTSLKGQVTSWFNTNSSAEAQAILMTAEEAFRNLPATSACDMPPEVQSLIEVKMSEELFRQHFEDLKAQGSLGQVVDYLKSQPVAEEAAPAAASDVELDRNSPTIVSKPPCLG